MATITLDYDARNVQVRKALDSLVAMGFVKVQSSPSKKTSLERAFEDIEKGRITFVNGPKKNKSNG